MPRLFAAIRPPKPIRERLLAIMGGIRGARWQDDDQLHLTLRFIGEVDRHVAVDVLAALAAIRHPAFDLALAGMGSFDRRGETETLWAGVTPHDQLKALHKKVDQACQRAGLEPERRAYSPHITLARLKRGAGPIQPFAERSGSLSSAPFTADCFCLFESELTPEGAIYSVIEQFRLI